MKFFIVKSRVGDEAFLHPFVWLILFGLLVLFGIAVLFIGWTEPSLEKLPTSKEIFVRGFELISHMTIGHLEISLYLIITWMAFRNYYVGR